ncbi:MAG: GAF domain-containing protein [Anaerolineae bacterium]|nr:GAF domain-containing protein [Anaerolineae bacterium]
MVEDAERFEEDNAGVDSPDAGEMPRLEEAVQISENVKQEMLALGDITAWRALLLRRVSIASLVLALPILIATSYVASGLPDAWITPVYIIAYLVVAVITFSKRFNYESRAFTMLSVFFALGVIDLMDVGVGGDGRMFFLAVPIMAVLLLGKRAGFIALALTSLTLIGFAFAFSMGIFTVPAGLEVNSASWEWWLSGVGIFLLLGGLLVTTQNYIVPNLLAALEHNREFVEELQVTHQVLQEQADALRVSNQLLQERATALETTALVAQDVASVLELQELLTRVVELISDRFEFYHAGIFLLDPLGEWAVLQAASSAGGQRMLENHHRLRVGHEGTVGYVTRYGVPRIALDVGADAVFFDNPDLPDTRSAMTLPLQVRGEIIGALDVQSTEPGAFTNEDAEIMQALANQVAVAISNARLFEQAEKSVEAERRAYGEISRESWRRMLWGRQKSGYQYTPEGVYSLEQLESTRVIGDEDGVEESPRLPELALPLSVRGQVIGRLRAHKPHSADTWSEEEIGLMHTLMEQLELALDGARLYEDIQRRAVQEQLVGEITSKMRETLDMDSILQTAAREIRDALSLAEVEVRLGSEVAADKSPAG